MSTTVSSPLRSLHLALRLACWLLAAHSSARAAEIELPAAAEVRGTLVRLGDLAVIRSTDPSEIKLLRGVPLATAPAAGEVRRFSVSEIAQLLRFSGIDPRTCRFLGAEEIVIQVPASPAIGPAASRVATASAELAPTLAPSPAAAPTAKLQQALEAYLRQQAPPAVTALAVKPTASPRVLQQLAQAEIVQVAGGRSPWTGAQSFQLELATPAGPTLVGVQAEVTFYTQALVARRDLAPGETLQAGDFEPQQVRFAPEARDLATRDDLQGAELVRGVRAGSPLLVSGVRRPRLVQPGDEIRVISVGQGVTIAELGKALGGGAYGELIAVEMPQGKRKLTVRVTGPQLGAVYALPAELTATIPRSPATNTTASPR